MNEKQIKEKLVKWVISIKYYSHDKMTARMFAIEDLKKIQTDYGWQPMKKAFHEKSCTSLGKFKQLCSQHKDLLTK